MSAGGAVRAAGIALFAIAVTVAAPARALAQDLSCDAGDKEVRDLVFRGNRAITDDDLARHIRTTPSALLRRTLRIPLGARRCLNNRELPRDLLKLRAYYKDRGYWNAKIDTLVQPIGRNVVRVVFTVDEGRPVIVRSYDVAGLSGIADSAEILRRRQLRVGAPYDFGLYLADLDSIVQRLRNQGYYRADLVKNRLDVSRDSLLADIGVTVLPGKAMRFSEPLDSVTPVDGRGQQMSTANIRRVMRITPGDLYSDQAIVEAQRNLFQLGVYRHIEISPLPDSLQPSPDSVKLLVLLTEDYMHHLDSEAGWATLDCGKVRLQYTDRNFAGSARTLEITGQASKLGYGYPLATDWTRNLCTLGGKTDLKGDQFSDSLHYFGGIALRQPRLLGTRWVPTLSLYSERRGEYKAYLRTTTAGADIAASREIASRAQLRLGYSVEYGRTSAQAAVLCAIFSRCDEETRAKIQEAATLGVASAAVSRIRTDNLISPTRGSLFRAEVRSSALPFTSKDLFFNKASGDVAYYRPFGWGNVLALRLRGGAVVGRRLSDTLFFVPPQERLYAGGPTSVRGFQPNELGDVVYIARQDTSVHLNVVGVAGTDTTFRYEVRDSVPYDRVVPLGGSSLLVANLEYRIRDPFFFPDLVQYTLFLDAGDVWNRSGAGVLGTPGAAIRVLSPVGPLQVNVGYNAHKRPSGVIYYEDPALSGSPVAPLYCASPGNTIDLKRIAGVLIPQKPGCDTQFNPGGRKYWYQKLTLTFSIGSDF